MDTVQITCTLQDVPTFLGVYPSDLLRATIHTTGTVIINADPHTREGSRNKSTSASTPISKMAASEPAVYPTDPPRLERF